MKHILALFGGYGPHRAVWAAVVLFIGLALASCTRDVPVRVAVKSVSVAPQTLELALGTARNLTATVAPADAFNPAVSWSSSDPAVVSVDAIGYVRALQIGSAVVTATTADGGFKASCAVQVVAPTRVTVSLSGFSGLSGSFEGSIDVPFDRTFDRVRAEILGLDWQVVGHVEAAVSSGTGGARVVLTLPTELSEADLCKAARDDYKDYEGWWPAEEVSDRSAKVAGLGDILAYAGNVCVGRLYISDGDRSFIYFHYADRPISLTGSNLHSPKESSTIAYHASFVSGWNAYANVSNQNTTGMITTTDLPAASSLAWRFEARP